MIKAVFFDIDGTLVSFDTHKIKPSSVDAIRLLQKEGIKVFIATGRQFESIPYLENISFDGYITLNGSCCALGDGQVIYKKPIAKLDIESYVNYQKQSGEIPSIFVFEKSSFINTFNDDVYMLLEMLDFKKPESGNLKEALNKDVFQIISFINHRQEKEILSLLPSSEATRWSPLFTDIIPKGNSKQVGIDQIINHFEIKLEETMAFGDGGNDISMLKHVHCGIAMGNASDEVKSVANYVTDSVDDDGVWNALKHFNLI